MSRKTKLAGIDVEVVSEQEAEECTAVICMEARTAPSPWKDNVETNCAGCGCAIVHRPYAPKKPPKVCLKCATAMFGATSNQ